MTEQMKLNEERKKEALAEAREFWEYMVKSGKLKKGLDKAARRHDES